MNYAKLKVAELKELLTQRGLSATGPKKQQLIDALEEDDAESGEAPEPEEEEEQVEVKAKTTGSTRSSTKRKASSPAPAGPTKQPKKAKPEPAAADTPTDTKSAPKITEAQFAPEGAKLDIPIDDGVSPSWHVYVDPDTGIIYDASLNQANASNNNNKFYRVQVCIHSLPCADITQTQLPKCTILS